MTGILEINDVALRMRSPEGDDIVEPGYALIDAEGGLLLGNAALQKSRINPPKTENDFWHWMDTQPIKAAARNYQHNADLVYAQLEDLCRRSGEERELDVLVPSNYTSDQLSMLLGIAQHAGVDVRQVYDAALASSINYAGSGIEQLVHTDIYLHHCVITQLVRVGDELSVEEFRVVPGAGLLNFMDAWLHGVSDLFVRGTRFDPLHDAETEQKAFDQIYTYYLSEATADKNSRSRLTIELENRHIELSRQQFTAMGESIYRKIQGVMDVLDPPGNADRLITDRVARLPGWQGILEANPLPGDAAVSGVPEADPHGEGEGVGYITSLALPSGPGPKSVPERVSESVPESVSESVPESVSSPPTEPSTPVTPDTQSVNNVAAATHLLRGSEALPLLFPVTYLEAGESGVRLRADESPSVIASIERTAEGQRLTAAREGEVSVNGEAVMSAGIRAGDVLGLKSAGVDLVLIQVRDVGAAN